jgi:hypothetical protein
MWRGNRAAVVARLRELAPYAAILMLPGGSVMALVLWLYRRQNRASLLAASGTSFVDRPNSRITEIV